MPEIVIYKTTKRICLGYPLATYSWYVGQVTKTLLSSTCTKILPKLMQASLAQVKTTVNNCSSD